MVIVKNKVIYWQEYELDILIQVANRVVIDNKHKVIGEWAS